jgi:hypothetical protein
MAQNARRCSFSIALMLPDRAKQRVKATLFILKMK